MSGVHQGPARVDRQLVEQPGNRSASVLRDTVVDYVLLLGDMQMDAGVGAALRRQNLAYRADVDGAQAVKCHTHLQTRSGAGSQRIDQAEQLFCRVGKTMLTLVQSAAVESTTLIQGGQ